MPARPGSLRSRLLGVAVAAGLLAVAACGGNDDSSAQGEEDGAGERESTASASPTASPEEPTAATPAEPTGSATPTATTSPSPAESPTSEPTSGPAGGAATLREALLSPELVPGLNDESSWTATRTAPVADEAFGWCQRFGALTLGASEGLERGFRAPGAAAGQQVLDVVDETNARRAEQVLRDWQRGCQAGRTRVGAVQTVATGADSAWWYLSSRPGGDGRWEAFGFARQDGRVTLLRMTHPGQDHSYEAGSDPLELALVEAAELLG